MKFDLSEIGKAVRGAERILVFTGAGMSTGSGIPDFRGPQGVWKKRRPVMIDEFLSSERARCEYWDYKLEGYEAFQRAEPNAAHRALVRLERTGRLLGLITQNVDGLHSRAGNCEDKLIEIHGTNRKVACLNCLVESDPTEPFRFFETTGKPPVCRLCGGWLKPATISFGQALREEDIQRSRAWASEADFVMALGSTLSVYPAASFPLLAKESGACYLVVNRGATDHDGLADFRLDGDLVELVPQVVNLLESE